jgi:hypothetical protein
MSETWESNRDCRGTSAGLSALRRLGGGSGAHTEPSLHLREGVIRAVSGLLPPLASLGLGKLVLLALLRFASALVAFVLNFEAEDELESAVADATAEVGEVLHLADHRVGTLALGPDATLELVEDLLSSILGDLGEVALRQRPLIFAQP